MIFGAIPKYCISLARRQDRRDKVIKQFYKNTLGVSFWPAVDGKTITVPELSVKNHEYNAAAIYACTLSHLNLIKHANENGFEYLCVFEDDIELSDDFNYRLELVEKLMLTEHLIFDMFYLGGHFIGEPMETKYKNIYQCSHVAGTYAYIVHKRVFDFILRNLTYQWGMDQFYADVVQERFRCYMFLPFPVDHVGGFSDIRGDTADYELTHTHYRKRL